MKDRLHPYRLQAAIIMKWFKHDTGANMDAKLQEVLLDYGLEGYGLYWYCLELISGKIEKENVQFKLEHDARIIARNTGSTVQKVQDIMNRFVELGLFEQSDGDITCFKLAKRLDQSMTSNPAMRQIINTIKQSHDYLDKSHDSVMIESSKPMTQSAKPMQDKTRLDKNRIKIGAFSKPSPEEVDNYAKEKNIGLDGFHDFYTSNGWKVGRNAMKDWQATARNWAKRSYSSNSSKSNNSTFEGF